MLLVIACFVAGAVLLFFLDLRVAVITLAPSAFSLGLTMATLHLVGWPIDIVGLAMLALILGVGVECALVRVYQRCLDERHPSHATVRIGSVVAASAALAGTLTVSVVGHGATRGAGITSSFAIGYCAIGVYLLQPLLRRMFSVHPVPPPDREHPRRWVMRRFRRLGGYPRCFAWFKLRLDPMFGRLGEFLPDQGTVLDIGCGFGVADAWMLGRSDTLRVVAVEPEADRVAVARFVLGTRGDVHVGAAPRALPQVSAAAVVCLDVIHHLDDAGLALTLSHARSCLDAGGRLVLRATVPASSGRTPFYRWFETRRLARAKLTPHYRQREDVVAAIDAAGFQMMLVEPTAPGREETWFIAQVSAVGVSAA